MEGTTGAEQAPAAPPAQDDPTGRAVRAVLAMHHKQDPHRDGRNFTCAGCQTHVTFTPWPCATVLTIGQFVDLRAYGVS